MPKSKNKIISHIQPSLFTLTPDSKIFVPSKYQSDIFDWAKFSTLGDCVVEACPGSGKTTVVVETARILFTDRTLRTLFCAFNKHIVEELKDKLPKKMRITTIHGLGKGCLYKVKKPYLLKTKYKKITQYHADTICNANYKLDLLFSKVARHLAELSKFCRLSLTDPNDHDAIKQMILDYGIDVDHSDLLIPYVNKVLEQGAMEFTETGVIDYTDMLWLPSSNYFNLEPVSLSDWTFVDEAQDLNQAQLSLVMKSRAAGGRMLFCGDRHQAIMGFAGALSNSMDQIINQTNAKILPLSICYRCPSSHVALAKELFPEIEPAPEAIEGIIENIPIDDLPSVVEENDLIICRLTAPLITQCIKLISKRIPARVRGTDIGKHLINIIEDISHFPGYSWHRFNFYLVKYLEDKIEGLKRHEDNESKIKALIDKCQGIYICYKAFRPQTLEGFCQEVQDLFSDDKPYIWLSTVHRAKGLESERVFILYPNTLPLKWDNQKPHELEQEYHLKNVALTRSKKYLAFVGGSQRPEKFYED